jgi:hypothetical protein
VFEEMPHKKQYWEGKPTDDRTDPYHLVSFKGPTIAKLQKRKTKILNEVKQKILKLPRINR